MTGYESKRAAAQDKLVDDRRAYYEKFDDLYAVYLNGVYDGKKAAQPAQEPVAYLCKPDENGLFGLPLKDKACKDCFPVYRQSPQPAQGPVAWADLQKEAQQIVESKFLWKKFIDGTPLSNDIACWMADFAQQYTTPPQPAQEPWRESASDYERGVIDGRQMQAQSSVDKAVNAMTQRPWVGLTQDEPMQIWDGIIKYAPSEMRIKDFARAIGAALRSKNT